jgi:hypothetical protein
MANEVVTSLRRAELQPAPASPASAALPTAIEQFQQALSALRPDDLLLEIASVTNVNGTSTKITMRAYRKGQRIMNDEHDV